jgi:hypothetical protein
MKKSIVIINEQHELLPEQEEILDREYQEVEFLKVPAEGWTLRQQEEVLDGLAEKLGLRCCSAENPADVVFVSPVPFLLKELAEMAICAAPEFQVEHRFVVKVFHNDNREKKELPNGRVISVVAEKGWQLV